MKKEYDFSTAEQGKYHRSEEELETPVYLDRKLGTFFREAARKKNVDVETLVNDVLEKVIAIQEKIK